MKASASFWNDFTLAPSNLLVVGMIGSGKTTFVNLYQLNTRPACRFIFDDLDRTWPRLKLRPCYTLPQLEASVPSRWSVFNPGRMFPGKTKDGLRWWCGWVYSVSQRGPGKKFVCVPEIWRWLTDDAIPQELALLTQAGRELDVETVFDTQRPELVNPSITGAATELVCFKLLSPEALREVGKLGADRERIAALPLGSFVSYNRLTGGELAGKVF